MKRWNRSIGTAVTVGLAGMVFAQGSLTPPGAPGTTMKTLGQLDTSIVGVSNRVEVVRSAVATAEPRTPISSATTITQPGSYYLTGNITVASGNGIVIESDEVTLDLNGFTIKSIAASAGGIGIYVNLTRRNIAIANGFIKGGTTYADSTFSGAGFNYGIYSSADSNITVSQVGVERCALSGIYLLGHDATAVLSCTVSTCVSIGILAGRVDSSIALECGFHGISGDQVSNCRGVSVLNGYGIYAETVCGSVGRTEKGMYGINATTVHDSYGYAYSTSSEVYGIQATTVNNCYGLGSSSVATARGISGKNINNCYGIGTSSSRDSYGIIGSTVNNSYGDSSCNGSYLAVGIDADVVQNSYGLCLGDSSGMGYGIYAMTVVNSRGSSARSNSESRGINAEGPVSDSYAYCEAGHAIQAESAENCRGESISNYGIYTTKSAMNCVGITSSGGYGIDSVTVGNCHGYGAGGIRARVVNGSYGEGTTGYGINATAINNSYGTTTSGIGVYGSTVNNCYGYTSNGTYGLYAGSMAVGCRGYSVGSGTGLYGVILNSCYGGSNSNGTGILGIILNSCYGYSASGTAVSATYKYNMP